MSRSSKKGPYVDENLLKKLAKHKPGDKVAINTYARSSSVAPEMVGYTIGVHNGKTFVPVQIREEMIGHKLGEFALTRKFTRHGGKMQREIEAAQQAAQTEALKQAKAAPETPKK